MNKNILWEFFFSPWLLLPAVKMMMILLSGVIISSRLLFCNRERRLTWPRSGGYHTDGDSRECCLGRGLPRISCAVRIVR